MVSVCFVLFYCCDTLCWTESENIVCLFKLCNNVSHSRKQSQKLKEVPGKQEAWQDSTGAQVYIGATEVEDFFLFFICSFSTATHFTQEKEI